MLRRIGRKIHNPPFLLAEIWVLTLYVVISPQEPPHNWIMVAGMLVIVLSSIFVRWERDHA